jgi:hypothetical protein
MSLKDQITGLQELEAQERQAISSVATRVDQGFTSLQALLTQDQLDNPDVQQVIDNMKQDIATLGTIAVAATPPNDGTQPPAPTQTPTPVPPPAPPPVVIPTGVAVSPSPVPSGATFTVEVGLSEAAPDGNGVVALQASDPSLPLSDVAVPQGATSVSFSGTALAASADTTITVQASMNGTSVSASVVVTAATPAPAPPDTTPPAPETPPADSTPPADTPAADTTTPPAGA